MYWARSSSVIARGCGICGGGSQSVVENVTDGFRVPEGFEGRKEGSRMVCGEEMGLKPCVERRVRFACWLVETGEVLG